MTLAQHGIALCLIALIGCRGHATLLEQTCDHVHTQLGAGPYESLTRSNETFTEGGQSYDGCVVRLVASADDMTAAQNPGILFGTSLPYCPDGVLQTEPPLEVPDEFGWCGDRMADGPDGTSYIVHRKDVFCAVEGQWDGGDDADTLYVPSPHVEVEVRCATGYRVSA